MNKAVTNMAASVRQRLLNVARERKEDFGLILTKYALERVLFLERTENSGSWPCDYAGARELKLRLPQGTVIPPGPPQPQKPGTLVAQADLRSDQIQDLADQIGELTKAAAGLDLNFFLRIQLPDKDSISKETIERINRLLYGISDELRFQ